MVTENKQIVTVDELQNRKIGLDLLRSYAIFSVVYGHGWYIVNNIAISKYYFSIKFDDVSIFFVLTGFLISLNLLKIFDTNKIKYANVKIFWFKRIIRTYPLYFFMLIFMGGMHFLTTKTIPENYVYYFGYFQNINWVHPSFYGELWSLAIQEWFYFLFPLALYGLNYINVKNKKYLIIGVTLACIILVTIFRISKINIYNYTDISYWDLNLRKQVATRFDSMLYGSIMAYILLNWTNFFKKNANKFLYIGLFLLILNKFLFLENWWYTNYLNLSIAPIGAALLLPFFYSIKFNLKIVNKIIFQISAISYAMYLVHMTPVMFTILPYVIKVSKEIFPFLHIYIDVYSYTVYWLLTILLSTAMHHFLAKPISNFLLSKYNNIILKTNC